MSIQAVLFDADGVVVLPWRFAAYLEREHQLTRAKTRDFFGGPFLECLTGRADLKEEISPFLTQWGWPDSVDAFLERWFTEEKVVEPKLIETITKLRAQGTPCYLATNQERYRFDYMQREMGFATLFDGLFVSCQIGHTKPDIAYFSSVTESLALSPDAILFWDDSAKNITVAREYGWQAEQYTDFASFQVMMDRYFSNSVKG